MKIAADRINSFKKVILLVKWSELVAGTARKSHSILYPVNTWVINGNHLTHPLTKMCVSMEYFNY
jgi:hypothetical protein